MTHVNNTINYILHAVSAERLREQADAVQITSDGAQVSNRTFMQIISALKDDARVEIREIDGVKKLEMTFQSIKIFTIIEGAK